MRSDYDKIFEAYIQEGMFDRAKAKLAGVGQTVTAKANIVHRGRSTHIWDIDIVNEDEKLISSCRLTNYIKPMKLR